MRRFGYYISSITHAYLTTPTLKLPDPDGHLLLELDENFNFIRKFNLTKNEYFKHEDFKEETPYLEDGRLVEWDGRYYMSSAIFYQNNEQYQKFGMEVQEISVDGDEAKATHIWNSVEHGIMGRVKNFMPVPDRPFTFISGTSTNGTQLIDIRSSEVQEVGRFDLDDLYRGNTNLIQTDDGYYTLTHKLGEDELGRKKYLEYIAKFNRDLMPVAISRPFKLTDSAIEFVTTMIELPNGKLLIGVTEMDDRPYAMTFDKCELFNSICL